MLLIYCFSDPDPFFTVCSAEVKMDLFSWLGHMTCGLEKRVTEDEMVR